MASTISSFSLRPPSLSRPRASHNAVTNKPSPAVGTNRRKLMLLSLTAAVPVLTAGESFAEDIPLFGLRKSVKKAEEEVVKLVKEAERDIKTAEKEIETAGESFAEDIPLFGLRKSVKKAEEEAVKLVKEAKREIKTAEKEIETAEMEIEEGVGFGNLAQAGVVAGAEVVGVLVATSIVNGILSPQK